MGVMKLKYWDEVIDPDGTRKYSCRTKKGLIEISYITNKNYVDVLCMPTHYSCNLGCTFCHLTKLGSEVSKPIELDDFLVEFCELLNVLPLKPNVLLSYMGVGEPTINIEFVVAAWKVANADRRHEFQVAISTMVPSNEILLRALKYLKENEVLAKIHYSLHAARHSVRRKLIPGSPTDINHTMRILEDWKQTLIPNVLKFHRTESPVEVHYTMITGVNDSEADLERLMMHLNCYSLPIKFIIFNEIDELKGSSRFRIQDWVERLHREGIPVVIYTPPGRNIGSSCGMFDLSAYRI